jgi:sarcosine/dimethylglycine N-methyltransferase
MSGLQKHYAARDIETRILDALRTAGLDPAQQLTPEQLGALDHFHTGGIGASLRLMELLQLQAGQRVLDLGAGLAGPARLIAARHACRVDCLELSADYCTGAALLNRLTGLEHLVGVHAGSALDMPFDDGTFDAVWMQNVGMNIADKPTLYAEICRVLKPGGAFAFQEMAAGSGDTGYYPLPWATEAADNCLLSIDDMHAALGACGFVTGFFEDASDSQLHGGPTAPALPAQAPLSLSVYVDDLALKAENATRSLQEGRIRFVRGVFRKPG